METPLDPDIVQHAMKVERTAAQGGNDPQAYTPATELKSLKPWTMLALAALGAVIISLWTWHWQMAMTAILLVTLSAWKSKIYGAFATPARWRGDAGSSPLERTRRTG